MSVLDFTRPRARARRKVRRRRPPSLREVYLKAMLAAMASHVAWLSDEIARGLYVLIPVLVIVVPPAVYIIRVALERAREYDRIGHPQPVDASDWFVLGIVILMEAGLWAVIL